MVNSVLATTKPGYHLGLRADVEIVVVPSPEHRALIRHAKRLSAEYLRRTIFPGGCSIFDHAELRINVDDNPSSILMQAVRLNKSCDRCRNRKVRCQVPTTSVDNHQSSCTNCVKRNEACHFSVLQRKLRPRSSNTSGTPSAQGTWTTTCLPPANHEKVLPHCFVDQLLEDPSTEATLYNEFSVLKVHDHRASSSGLAFFSDHRIECLVQKLGDSRLRDLVNSLDYGIRNRLLTRTDSDITKAKYSGNSQKISVSAPEAHELIQEYFSSYHGVYPFLDREDFENKAFNAQDSGLIERCAQFSALYYAILALGSQRSGGGSYEPGKGRAWQFFSISLRYALDIRSLGDSIVALQALTAMSIFAMSSCYLQVDHTLLSEAIQMALRLRYHKSSIDEHQTICLRTFWVIYQLEKHNSFQSRIASIVADYDIGCPIPSVSGLLHSLDDWFLISIRFARLLSIAYELLFSTTASTRHPSSQLLLLNQVQNKLEHWRQSIPAQFRPLEPLHRPHFETKSTKQIALLIQYYYYHLLISLERLRIYLGTRSGDSDDEQEASKQRLLRAAKAVVELTRFIDVEPHTPIFILAIMPLSALFILFDFVIHNPLNPDTRINLILLDVVSGYFSLLEHESDGTLPGSYLSEFVHIARKYVQDQRTTFAQSSLRPDREQIGHIQEKRDEVSADHFTPLPENLQGETIAIYESDAYGIDSEPQLLNYPTPANFAGSSDIQSMAGLDFRSLFSWPLSEFDFNEN